MRESDAISAAQDLGLSDGEQVSVQSQGQADNPHGSDDHVDGWSVTRSGDSYSADKIHGK